MKKFRFCLLLIIGIGLLSCSKETLKGDGDNITVPLSIAGFTGVETHYGIRAEIGYGTTVQVTASGHQTLVNALEAYVQRGVLILRYRGSYTKVRNENLVVHIQLPAITKAVIHGSGDISLNGFAGGTIFEGDIQGSGDILVTGSNFQNAILRVNGSGNVDAKDLRAQQATADIHGSGSINVSVSGRLEALIYGSGNVYYWGNPVVQIDQKGSGKVVKK